MTDHSSQVEEIFSEAWQQVLTGRSIETVLADYPQYAAQLEPMLRLTERVRAMPAPALSPDALAKIRQRTRAALSERPAQAIAVVPDPPEEHLQSPLLPANGMGADGIRPGEMRPEERRGALRRKGWLAPLFSTMQVSTGVLLLLLVVTIVSSIAFVLAMLKPQESPNGPAAVVEYSGTIARIEGAAWQVDEFQVLVDGATEIHGTPAVGATMRCIANPLGANKMKALEVWVLPAPGAPTVTPGGPTGYAPAPRRAAWLDTR